MERGRRKNNEKWGRRTHPKILGTLLRGSIIVWRLGGFGLISDAEFGFHKIISAVYGFCIVMRLRKIGI